MKLGDLFNEDYLEKLGLSKKSTGDHKMVADIVENDNVSVDLKVISKKLQESKDGKKFLLLTLADRTGEIRAIDWSNAVENDSRIKINSIVKINGRVSNYLERLQINVDRDRTSITVLNEGEYDPSLFVAVTQKNVGGMFAEFKEIVDEVEDENIKNLLKVPFEDHEFLERFLQAPAAIVVHHAYKGGLLEHTLGVMKLCRAISDLYPEANRDLLIAGAALHDLGKVYEYEVRSFGIERTTEGELIGHIVMGSKMLEEWSQKVRDFPKRDLYHLVHLVLSHHGELEWGSPTVPKTLEAMILHNADDLDSKIGQINSLREKNSNNEWSEYDRYLGRKIMLNWEEIED